MRGGSLLALVLFFPLPSDQIGGGFLVCYFFSSLSLLLFVFFGCSDGMEREACVCDHGFERSDLCAEIIIIIIITDVVLLQLVSTVLYEYQLYYYMLVRSIMYVQYSHTYSKSMDQPSIAEGCQSRPGQLNRENEYFPVRVCA